MIKKNIRNFFLLVGLIAFAIWFALHKNYQEVIHNLKEIPFYTIVFVCLLGILYYCIQGYLLTCFARKYKKDTRLLDGIENAYIAAFFNGVTPLGGGQIAQSYAFRKIGISLSNIASILWVDFFMYQLAAISLAVFLVLSNLNFALGILGGSFVLLLVGIGINSFVIIALWMMSRFPKLFISITHFAINVLFKIKIIKNKEETLENWTENLNYFSKEVSTLRNNLAFIISGVGLNIVRLLIFYIIPYFIALSLKIEFTLVEVIHVIAVSSFIHMLNALTPLPGDTGFTETVFIMIFANLFGNAHAAAIMIIWRSATYYINILIGGVFFLIFKMKKNKIQEN
ncbi:MAG: YbhN family protein [Breznakia sp.]